MAMLFIHRGNFCHWLGAILLTVALTARADLLKLKNGTAEECDIVAEDDSQYTVEVQNATGTVSSKHYVKKSDVTEVVRSTPEQKAQHQLQRDYLALQKYQLGPNSFLPTYYPQVIAAFRQFQTDHPASAYQPEIETKITQWQAEASQIATGMVKYQSQWITAQAWREQWEQQQGQQGLARAQALLRERMFPDAITVLKQLETTKQPALAAEVQRLLAETYRTWTETLTRQQQLLTQQIEAYKERVPRVQQYKQQAEQNYQQVRSQRDDKMQHLGDQSRTTIAETELMRAQKEYADSIDQLNQTQNRLREIESVLMHIQGRANIAAGIAPPPPTATATQAPPAVAETPTAGSPGVLEQMADLFKRYWVFGVIAFLGIVWGVSRLMARD